MVIQITPPPSGLPPLSRALRTQDIIRLCHLVRHTGSAPALVLPAAYAIYLFRSPHWHPTTRGDVLSAADNTEELICGATGTIVPLVGSHRVACQAALACTPVKLLTAPQAHRRRLYRILLRIIEALLVADEAGAGDGLHDAIAVSQVRVAKYRTPGPGGPCKFYAIFSGAEVAREDAGSDSEPAAAGATGTSGASGETGSSQEPAASSIQEGNL
jgi:hypothetical protein